jgi:hypothetical protein
VIGSYVPKHFFRLQLGEAKAMHDVAYR